VGGGTGTRLVGGALVAVLVVASGLAWPAPGSATTTDEAPGAVVSAGDVVIVEGNHGKQVARVSLTLSDPQPVDTHVAWHTVDGTATAPDDYRAVSRSTLIRAGRTLAVTRVPVFADTDPEGDETLTVELTGTDNPALTIGRPTGTVTILDDDPPADPPTVSVGDLTMVEGNHRRQPARLNVTLSAPQPVDTYVDWHTVDGTATAPDDYRTRTRRTRIRAGRTSATIRVPVFADTVPEGDETFTVELTGTDSPALTIGRATGTVTILDDDGPVERRLRHDYTGDGTADRVWVADGEDEWGDPATHWMIEDDPQPLHSVEGWSWELSPWPVVDGDYDGDGVWEPAWITHDGDWVSTAGVTKPFPFPEGNEVWGAVPVPGDYDGDGTTDPAWYSSSTATWYVHGREAIQFGTPAVDYDDLGADVPVPADYDGDGAIELAVYDPLSNEWRIHGSDAVVVLGTPGDQPVPADYDGDGADDVAVLDTLTGTWSVHGMGVIGTTPPPDPYSIELGLPADYDGDGVAQIAYDTGWAWHVDGLPLLESSDPWVQPAIASPSLVINLVRLAFIKTCSLHPPCPLPGFGTAHDFTGDGRADRVWIDDADIWWLEHEPMWDPAPEAPDGDALGPWPVAPGDYDGDGRWEPAVITASGVWVSPRENVSFPFPGPNPADGVPVPADYDGDGATDRAWFSTATATWYVEGQAPVQFGEAASEEIIDHAFPLPLSFDIPVPADYSGDGRADLAVYNPWTNSWRVEGVDGLEEILLGEPGDQPVPADYDGDGRAEPAVVDGSTGKWAVLDIGIVVVLDVDWYPIGIPADHDGDGRADLAFADARNGHLVWNVPGLPPLQLDITVIPAVAPPNLIAHLTPLGMIKFRHLCDLDPECDVGP
jgi:hypothetical protein